MELLAPGGDVDCIKAAIVGGADAVYCGLDRFNARNRAANITINQLNGILRLAHKHKCQVFLTLNIIIVESEIPALFGLLNTLANTPIDGIIVQDLGMLYILATYFKGLQVHASTQLTTHNTGQIRLLNDLGATRVNLSRELSLQEISKLSSFAHSRNVLIEVFVHGSNCLSFSGICYMSSLHSGNSGNRGRCSQPCRDQYITTAAGKDFPLNLKDNSAFFNLEELADAGVDSLKIEGRIKKFHYVYTVVSTWREQLRRYYAHIPLSTNNRALYTVFNRDFSNAFLKGRIDKEMFIDNPRDHSAIHLARSYDGSEEDKLERAKGELYNKKTEIILSVKKKIEELSFESEPISIHVSGHNGELLTVLVKTPHTSFEVLSDVTLMDKGAEVLDEAMLLKRFKSLHDGSYVIQNLNMDDLSQHVFLPFKEISSIKRRIQFHLNGEKEIVSPVDIPRIERHEGGLHKPRLSVLISSVKDVTLAADNNIDYFYQVPDCLEDNLREVLSLFRKNDQLIPWFPSILIGPDFDAGVTLLHELKPRLIVTNNLGIVNEAIGMGVKWIAGPYLNSANSYSLLSLKENLNCSGAFISNELSKMQIKSIKPPLGFGLFYSIYHPIVLMTSRQCLFHQVTGCEKSQMDASCLQSCSKSASITNLKKTSFILEKTKGNYHTIYNATNFLNPEIVEDMPDRFSSFLIDLRDVNQSTPLNQSKAELIHLFFNFLQGMPGIKEEIVACLSPTTRSQYQKGV